MTITHLQSLPTVIKKGVFGDQKGCCNNSDFWVWIDAECIWCSGISHNRCGTTLSPSLRKYSISEGSLLYLPFLFLFLFYSIWLYNSDGLQLSLGIRVTLASVMPPFVMSLPLLYPEVPGNGCAQLNLPPCHILLSYITGFDIKIIHQRIQTTCLHASYCHHCNVDFVLFHNVTCYTNYLLSCIHVNTAGL